MSRKHPTIPVQLPGFVLRQKMQWQLPITKATPSCGPPAALWCRRATSACILGQGLPLHQADYRKYFPNLDVTMLTQQWSTAKELAMLPGAGVHLPP